MGRGASREGVACASGLNWCSFILLLFGTISSYWTWGYAYPPAGTVGVASVSISVGPWIAAQAWGTYPVPCNCQNGVCWSWCYVGTTPVSWSNIPVEAACGPLSNVFLSWSGPLGYCKFPENFTIPTPPPTPALPPGSYGFNTYGGVPEGTTFNGPSEPTSAQALMIIATITVFFAAVAGCADSGMDSEKGSKAAGSVATLCSLIGWVFCLAAYCLWTTFPYIVGIQQSNPKYGVPVWVNVQENQMQAVDVYDAWLGAGWATSLTASILTIFANIIHCASMKGDNYSDDDAPSKYNAPPPQDDVPAAAVPVAAAPVPVTAAAVPVAAAPVPPAVGTKDVANV